ncbi:hypothetical protein KSS87_004660 [Heliosperma pusillum]|nr:hypothetical protein KSS87_004660 [Heliosperma pusillum]
MKWLILRSTKGRCNRSSGNIPVFRTHACYVRNDATSKVCQDSRASLRRDEVLCNVRLSSEVSIFLLSVGFQNFPGTSSLASV